MFRIKGILQINSNREIHFPAVPYYTNFQEVPLYYCIMGILTKRLECENMTCI